MPRVMDHEDDRTDLDNSQDEVTLTGLSVVNGHHDQDELKYEPNNANAKSHARVVVKPYIQALTPLDLDSCVRLEEVTFPPHERCKREKFEYRFTKCGELSLGLFTSADTTLATANCNIPSSAIPGSAETASTAVPVYSGTPDRKSILLGHVIATKTTNMLVRDEDMELPLDWRAAHARSIASPKEAAVSGDLSVDSAACLGHKEEGRTICVHSFAILPEFQKQGLGRLLMRAYIQRMRSAGVADRIALIAHEHLVPFYESLGFESQGPSPCAFGGGDWTDLVLFIDPDDD